MPEKKPKNSVRSVVSGGPPKDAPQPRPRRKKKGSSLAEKQRAIEAADRSAEPQKPPAAERPAETPESPPEATAQEARTADRRAETSAQSAGDEADPRGETVGTTIYIYEDQRRALLLDKVDGKGTLSEQIRELLDRAGRCSDEWRR